MGIEVTPGGVQVALRWALEGDNEEMVSTIGLSGRGPYADAQAVAVAVAGLALADITAPAMLGVTWTFVGATAYVYQDGGAAEVGESNVNSAGSMGSQSLTSNTAVLVKKRTAQSGRRGQGRMYIPGGIIAEGDVGNNGSMSAGAVAALQTRFTDFLDDLNAAFDPDEVVLWHSLGGPSGVEVLPGTPVTALVVDTVVATQRRRMRS